MYHFSIEQKVNIQVQKEKKNKLKDWASAGRSTEIITTHIIYNQQISHCPSIEMALQTIQIPVMAQGETCLRKMLDIGSLTLQA